MTTTDTDTGTLQEPTITGLCDNQYVFSLKQSALCWLSGQQNMNYFDTHITGHFLGYLLRFIAISDHMGFEHS